MPYVATGQRIIPFHATPAFTTQVISSSVRKNSSSLAATSGDGDDKQSSSLILHRSYRPCDEEILTFLQERKFDSIFDHLLELLQRIQEKDNQDNDGTVLPTGRLVHLDTLEKVVADFPQCRERNQSLLLDSIYEAFVNLHHLDKVDGFTTRKIEDIFNRLDYKVSISHRTAKRYESLLELLLPFDPSVHMYNLAVTHDIRRKDNIDFGKSKALLEKAMQAARDGNESARPNRETWHEVLRSAYHVSTQTVTDMLQQMKTAYSEGDLKEPVTEREIAVAVRSIRIQKGPKKAEEMLEELNHDKTSPAPDLYCFNEILRAWKVQAARDIKSGKNSVAAGERADAILDHMVMLHGRGILQEYPTSLAFNTVMQIWGKLGRPKKVEEVYAKQVAAFYQGHEKTKPDNEGFRILMRVIRLSGSARVGEQADSVLIQMLELGVPENIEMLHAALKCWKLDTNNPRYHVRCTQLSERIKQLDPHCSS